MLTENQQRESDQKREWIKINHHILYEKFAGLDNFPPVEKPITILMAGSPGAGKTEFSKNFNKEVLDYINLPLNTVRIDADEIREIMPGYDGLNSEIFQSGACLGVDKLYQYALKKRQNVIIDGTFAKYDKSCDNIIRSLSKGRTVGIFYIYQEPMVAWEFTQKRAVKESRIVPVEVFVDSLFDAKENVEKAKNQFGDKIILFLIEKNYENGVKKMFFNVDSIDNYIKIGYDKGSLLKEIQNV